MIRLTAVLLAIAAGCSAAEPTPELQAKIEAVDCNRHGWPKKQYVAFFGTMGAGNNSESHNTAWGINTQGWKHYVDQQVQPLLDGPNPPSRLVVHCVGPGWPRFKDDEIHLLKSGRAHRWFEYDWPLTVAEGRQREDGRGRWPAMPTYLEGFAEAWRSVADGSRSRGYPVETYAYTGLLQTPWLEELRENDPDAYRERLIAVAEFFREAGFAGLYVDATASLSLPPDHLGLKVMREINDWPNFFIGVEAYPPAKHDETTGPLRYFVVQAAFRTQHPRHPRVRNRAWQSRLDRDGLIVWLNNWGGGKYQLTPETAKLCAALDADIGVSWARWEDLAPQLPLQRQLNFDLEASEP